ncbi:hypothetical protein EW145_g1320 [Phellinidium pouzarii]|uniref:Uncharacterized protein n=1 Tax=Phellinidium pouzarii TaxID=167371 RepID=A0A4S4LEY9_9AGAM|nr:hypothetical protein EW145_g1320 [Phellinidium pouzarii]
MALMTHLSTSSTTVDTTFSSTPFVRENRSPSTCNHLDAAQRSRFIRTSRKLGKVLGTTPYIMESLPSLPAVSMSMSVTGMASKRNSAPPTPTASWSSFDLSCVQPSTQSSSEPGLSRTSTISDEQSESGSTHPFITEGSQSSHSGHSRVKTSDDELSPLAVFPGPETSRHNKLHQPVLRLPPSTSGAKRSNLTPGSPLRETFSFDVVPKRSDLGSASALLSTSSPPSCNPNPPDEVTRNPVSEDFDGDDDLEEAEIEARLRKRRMDKLMRHLGECVPSELVFGSGRPRGSMGSISIPSSVPESTMAAPASGGCVAPSGSKQTKIMRRVSVISAARSHSRSDGREIGLEYGNGTEKNDGRVKGGTRHLVEDEWTPEAYENVVRRLRRLK